MREEIGRGGRVITIRMTIVMLKKPLLTLSYFKTKIAVLLQGSETSLQSVQEMFPRLRAEVDMNRSSSYTSAVPFIPLTQNNPSMRTKNTRIREAGDN